MKHELKTDCIKILIDTFIVWYIKRIESLKLETVWIVCVSFIHENICYNWLTLWVRVIQNWSHIICNMNEIVNESSQ